MKAEDPLTMGASVGGCPQTRRRRQVGLQIAIKGEPELRASSLIDEHDERNYTEDPSREKPWWADPKPNKTTNCSLPRRLRETA